MIRQLCRRGRLRASIQEQQQEYTDTRKASPKQNDGEEITAANIFSTSLDTLAGSVKQALHPSSEKSHILPPDVYDLLLSYVNSQLQIPFRRYDDFPHPLDAKIYSHWATPHSSITIHGRTYAIYSKHRGNASISFAHPHYPGSQMGFINSIWSQQIEGACRTFLFIQQPIFLSNSDAISSPYASQALVGLMGILVYDRASENCIVIEAEHVQGHVPFYRRPPGTFGIREGTMVMLNSLHRYR